MCDTGAAALLIPGFGPAIAGGILLATFGAAGISALTGSIIATFVSIGVPEEEAHHYQRELRKGRTIVKFSLRQMFLYYLEQLTQFEGFRYKIVSE